MEELVNILKEKKLTIGSVESLTGGLFASSLASIPGVSSVFKGALVTYAIEIKENVCHVPCEIIDQYGVVSSECAYEMAKHGAQVLNTDVTISFTGNAGPLCLDDVIKMKSKHLNMNLEIDLEMKLEKPLFLKVFHF